MENRKFKKLGGDFIEDIGQYVREYVKNNPNVTIYVGCDSDEVNASTLCYVSTICFYDELKRDGIHYVFCREFISSKRKLVAKTGDAKEDKKRLKDAKQENIFNKIWGEVERLAEIGLYLEDVLSDVMNPMTIEELKKKYLSSHQNKLVNLDVDINPDPGLDIPTDLKGKASDIKKYIEENRHRSAKNKSNFVYDAARAYLEGLGFRTRFKPNAWAATVAADFHVRGAKKRTKKSRSFRRNQTEI